MFGVGTYFGGSFSLPGLELARGAFGYGNGAVGTLQSHVVGWLRPRARFLQLLLVWSGVLGVAEWAGRPRISPVVNVNTIGGLAVPGCLCPNVTSQPSQPEEKATLGDSAFAWSCASPQQHPQELALHAETFVQVPVCRTVAKLDLGSVSWPERGEEGKEAGLGICKPHPSYLWGPVPFRDAWRRPSLRLGMGLQPGKTKGPKRRSDS